MFLACIVSAPFLLLVLYQNIRQGDLFSALLAVMTLALVFNIGAGILNGDIEF